jgi:glycogen(starch) synthase
VPSSFNRAGIGNVMNIAIFASAFYPHVGGVEELCRQLAHAYRAAGHECIILTNRWPRSLPEFEEYEGIPVYRLAMRVPEGSLKARANYRLTHNSIRREMLSILRRHKIDVLHVQCVSSNGFYALLAKRELGLPLVVSTQGERTMDAGRLYEKSPFANRILRELLKEADAISACSENTLNDLAEWYGSDFGDRSRVIYNGIRLADFDAALKFEHRRPYILGIGRLVPQKGFDVLIRAFAHAGIESHDLVIAGEGAERGALEALVAETGIGGRVRFLGRADRAQIVALFCGCEFFVLPSRMEPLGIVNLEAMAAGRAVIASRVGGVPEIVQDGETGLLVPAEDIPALATAIQRLALDHGLRERLGVAGRGRVKSFDWEAIAEKYLELYRIHSRRGATLCS